MKTIKSPKFCNAEKTAITCTIKNKALGWIPFTASADDVDQNCREIYAELMAGDHGPIAEFTAAISTEDPKMTGIEFDGVMCSATSKDLSGVMAVRMAFQMQGANFKPTVFIFENGNTLKITRDNIDSFTAVLTAFRQSFFEDA